jgi:hypothetical protein
MPELTTLTGDDLIAFTDAVLNSLEGENPTPGKIGNEYLEVAAADITDAGAAFQAFAQAETAAEQRTAMGLGTAGVSATIHPNASASLSPLAEMLRSGVSTAAVVVGDSTGHGTVTIGNSAGWRWPRFLAKKIADNYPAFGVRFHQITADATKAWVTTEVQARPNGELREYWLPATAGIPDWVTGTSYTAGQFVKTTSGGTKYWFCKTTHDAGSSPPAVYVKNTSVATPEWLQITQDSGPVASGEESPYTHDTTATASKVVTEKKVEIEVDFIMPPLAGLAAREYNIFTKRGATASDGVLQVALWNNGMPVLRWWENPGPGYDLNATGNTALPVAEGTRLKLRIRFTPNNGSIGVIQFDYATYSAGTWSAYTPHYTRNRTATNWFVPSGKIYLGGVYGGTSTFPSLVVYGAKIRRGILDTDPIDFDLPIDRYSGYGTKDRALLGSPVCDVWSASWSGSTINQILGDNYIVGTTYFDIPTDIPTATADAAFVNFGHNGQSQILSPGLNAATFHNRISSALISRLPCASVITMSQNPGVVGDVNGALDYSIYEPTKAKKHAFERQAALRVGDGFIDMNHVFREYPAPADLLVAQDGLHPNEIGSQLWSDTIYTLLENK